MPVDDPNCTPPPVTTDRARENADADTAGFEALALGAGAFKDALLDLASLVDAGDALVAQLRVPMDWRHGAPFPDGTCWCRVCGATWGSEHAEAAPRCAVPPFVERLEKVRREAR